MQLQTVATIFAVLAGLASASNQGSYSPGGGSNSGPFTGGSNEASELTDAEITAVLAAHNKYRSGCGLKPVNYSKKVASVAQRWARQNPGGCRSMQHNSNRSGLGENIACQTGGGRKIDQITAMIGRWGDEYKNCKRGTAGCGFVGGSSTQGATGHFTQMVDATCQEIGCAYNKGFVVCNYHPAGNMRGSEKKNICPNGFKGYGSGAGGVIDGGSGTSPAPGGSYGPTTPVNPGTSYTPGNNNNSGNNGGNYGNNSGSNNNNNYGNNSGNNGRGGRRGGNTGGNVRYYTKTITKPTSFNNGGFIPVRNNSGNNSGNTSPSTRPSQSYGGSNNNSGGSSYGNNNNNNGGQPDKDCDETKKAKKL